MSNGRCGACGAPKWNKTDTLPDSDLTVLVHTPDADDPITPGFHDGNDWFDFNGAPLRGGNRVTGWLNQRKD